MKFRHELKHAITPEDRLILRSRLNAVMKIDPHAKDGVYHIRSLYFDNIDDIALVEKKNGVARREKFRIRYYNGDTSFIHLEKKSKIVNLCNKLSCPIEASEVQRIIDGDISWMKDDKRELVNELYAKMRGTGLKPKTIVDYTRDPYIYKAGNVRVTLDYDIRTATDYRNFLDWNCVTVPADPTAIILEVKWDEYLPDIIRDVVQLKSCQTGAYSKYAACRVYG